MRKHNLDFFFLKSNIQYLAFGDDYYEIKSSINILTIFFFIVLGFDERKDWTKQANGKNVQECHITFTDQTDYVDQGTVEPVPKDCTEKFKGSENAFKEVWKVTGIMIKFIAVIMTQL